MRNKCRGEFIVDEIIDVGADENITMDLRYELNTARNKSY